MEPKPLAIAKKVRARRKKAGLSQDKLSKLVGISLYTLTKIETGVTPNPRVSTMKKLAEALKVTVEKLIR